MDALTIEAAQMLLQGETEPLAPCMQGGISEMKELLRACLAEGIPASVAMDPCCDSGSCAPKAQLLVRTADAPKVGELFRQQWLQMVKELGVNPADLPAARQVAEGEEPPCPACGTAAPLVDGACSDCGLQLE